MIYAGNDGEKAGRELTKAAVCLFFFQRIFHVEFDFAYMPIEYSVNHPHHHHMQQQLQEPVCARYRRMPPANISSHFLGDFA